MMNNLNDELFIVAENMTAFQLHAKQYNNKDVKNILSNEDSLGLVPVVNDRNLTRVSNMNL